MLLAGGEGEPERLGVIRASANLFSVLGVQPERGRTFLAGEDEPGSSNVERLSGSAKDANVSLEPPKTGEFSIGHAVASKAEVDAVLAQAEAAGATVTDQPHDRPWGIYSGYFRDLDGHLWEILWNPRLDVPQP